MNLWDKKYTENEDGKGATLSAYTKDGQPIASESYQFGNNYPYDKANLSLHRKVAEHFGQEEFHYFERDGKLTFHKTKHFYSRIEAEQGQANVSNQD
jgi:hypothetical protein